MISEKKLTEHIKFLGSTNQIKGYLSAMDLFLFPSRFEGLPLVLVEAQANGIPIVCSDVITDEAIFSNNVLKLSLEMDKSVWVDSIIKMLANRNENVIYALKEYGFDINETSEMILERYKGIR